MTAFSNEYLDMGLLDDLSYGNTFVHRLDPRAKLLTTLVFVIVVVSFSKYEIAGLMPFFLFPTVIIAAGNIPLRLIVKKILIVSPFALAIGIFNPILDTGPMVRLGQITITSGWVAYFSILIKFILTITAALILIATTSFQGVCFALEKLGVPTVFVVQLMFLYRYLFVLVGEVARTLQAYNSRSFGNGSPPIRVFTQILGNLFLRTVDRSERIYAAMASRGFDGTVRFLRPHGIKVVEGPLPVADAIFVLSCITCFMLFRVVNIAQSLGGLISEVGGGW